MANQNLLISQLIDSKQLRGLTERAGDLTEVSMQLKDYMAQSSKTSCLADRQQQMLANSSNLSRT